MWRSTFDIVLYRNGNPRHSTLTVFVKIWDEAALLLLPFYSKGSKPKGKFQ